MRHAILKHVKDIFARSRFNPILKPGDGGWVKLYNPGAAVSDDGKIHIFPRVTNKRNISNIGHAISEDGEQFVLKKELAITPMGCDESRGVEDPRVSCINGTYHMTFAAYDGIDVILKTAISSDLNGPWLRKGDALPDFHFTRSGGVSVSWESGRPVEIKKPKGKDRRSKSGALFPRKIGGRYFALFGEFRIWLATSIDGYRFEVIPSPFLCPRKGSSHFDNVFVEMGPPPIETEYGWLVLYHGVNEFHRYQLGYLLLDLNNPARILYRSPKAVFSPNEPYEITFGPIDVVPGANEAFRAGRMHKFTKNQIKANNTLPQVIFCTGAILNGDLLRLYYGAADNMICTATASLSEVIRNGKIN